MSPFDVLFLGLAAVVLAALAVVAWRSGRRESPARRPAVYATAGRASAHPELAAALSAIVGGDPRRAVESLRRVVQEDTDAIEVYVLLGDLQRDLGQVERAIRIHRSVLQRTDLTGRQRTDALTALARDYEAAGFLDRALGAFDQVARDSPDDPVPLAYLRKLYEQARAWSEARDVQERIVKLTGESEKETRLLAYLQDRVAGELREKGDTKAARRLLERALARDPGCVPVRLHLGDLLYEDGRFQQAWTVWRDLLDVAPERAWMVLPRLEGLHRARDDMDSFVSLLRGIVMTSPEDWRTRAFLAVRLAELGQVEEAREHLAAARDVAPSSPTVQRAAWRMAADHGVSEAEARDHAAAFGSGEPFLDALSCVSCRYRTTEARWRCPHCHRWGTFVDEIPRPFGGRGLKREG